MKKKSKDTILTPNEISRTISYRWCQKGELFMKKPSKKVVSVLLPIELYEEIEKLTEYTQRSKSAYIRQVLRIYLRYYAEHAEEAESDPLIVK